MDPARGQPFPLHQIHFLAGVKGSTWLGHSTAKCLRFPLNYEGVRTNSNSAKNARPVLSRDVALIVLKDNLPQVGILERNQGEVAPSDSLVHASYAADRRYRLTGHFGCHLLQQDEDLWFTDCDTHAASSGGPVLVKRDDSFRLAAIMVAVTTNNSIAVPIAKSLDLLGLAECQ